MNNQCASCKDSYRYLKPYGSRSSRIVVVGEQPITDHPGESDVAFGLDIEPRVRSGRILERVFRQLDVEIEDLYWTNAYKCPNARPDACLRQLQQELRSFGMIVALGTKATNAMEIHRVDFDKSIWHPAYILRNESRFAEYVAKWEEIIAPPSGQVGLDAF